MANCEFFLIRYVPDLVKNEPINIGIILLEGERGTTFAGVRFAHDFSRVLCLDPNADLEMLRSLEVDIRHKFSNAIEREKLLEVLPNLSNTLQVSDIKACQTDSPDSELDRLAQLYLEPSAGAAAALRSPRAAIRRRMQKCFEQCWPDFHCSPT